MTPSVDFDKFVFDNTPAKKRLPKFMAWHKGGLSQMKRLNAIYTSYINGWTGNYFSGTTTYSVDDEVEYRYKVYKSLTNNNLHNTPDTHSTQWLLILNNFIGAKERVNYRYHKLTLEWALNRYFHHELSLNSFVGFRQPDDPINPTNSDIFINTVENVTHSFIIAQTETTSDSVGITTSSGFVTDVELIPNASTFTFQVNIPSSVYHSINTNATLAEKIVRGWLDNFVPSGINYIIVTY